MRTPLTPCLSSMNDYAFNDIKNSCLFDTTSRSRYACFGLWIIDLRSIYPPLAHLLSSSPRILSLGPLTSYPHLTELTRNPPSTRSPIEKNWFLFHPRAGSSFIHYDISTPIRGRTFAKLLGGGLTTPNLTDPFEDPCLPPSSSHLNRPSRDDPNLTSSLHGGPGKWHQATPSLRLILCSRSDPSCTPLDDNTVFFALVHRKHENYLKLPLRYERNFIVWAATPPFEMLGVSRHPVLLANETTSGWDAWQGWDDDERNAATVRMNKERPAPPPYANDTSEFRARSRHRRRQVSSSPPGNNATDPFGGKGYWAYFTYTVSLAWAAGRHGVEAGEWVEGYLDDEVVLSIGVDDKGMGIGRVMARELVECLRACPGRRRRA